MSEQPQPPAPEAEQDGTNPNAAFLPIGLVFFILGLSGLTNESMRSTSYAFLPIGIAFLLLGVRSGRGEKAAGAPPGEPPVDPDITPR
jgi:hypothetical protein